MITNSRVFATRIAGSFHTDHDRAWTTHHHHGQMTIGDYRALDAVEPCQIITGLARVRTRPWPDGVYEYLGLTEDGWLVRAELVVARYTPAALPQKWATYLALPFLRTVDDVTGYAMPDLLAEHTHKRSSGGKVMDVPGSLLLGSPRP